jgi:hypothetical protein
MNTDIHNSTNIFRNDPFNDPFFIQHPPFPAPRVIIPRRPPIIQRQEPVRTAFNNFFNINPRPILNPAPRRIVQPQPVVFVRPRRQEISAHKVWLSIVEHFKELSRAPKLLYNRIKKLFLETFQIHLSVLSPKKSSP